MAEEKTVVVATTKPVKEKTAALEKKAEAPKKTATVKVDITKKADADKKPAAEKKAAPKKEAAPKKAAAVKKADTKKVASKKVATPKKTTEPKAVLKDELHIQISGKSYTQEDLTKIAKDVWVYDMQQKASSFKSVALYVKPEEMKVYFVVNGTESGSFLI